MITQIPTGALLTAYVGVNGLIERMASDRCLPQFLLNLNRWRRTSKLVVGDGDVFACLIPFILIPLYAAHNIIFGYFLLATGLVSLFLPSSYSSSVLY